ncbi:plasmid mobilization protein [Eubacterium xylanophilum]|uniref:plasmid mobilization protein n=1 Tax=Eubacterium xylanophilum TaxID=39497 RepID=UPI00047DA429|nr:hypothetical protein [Eubacterium xylanophilum]
MDLIYRRDTQDERERKKKYDKNRKRALYFNFRVSATEKELINKRIALSGLPKAKFFIESCLYQRILVRGNIKTYEEIRDEMERIKDILLSEDKKDKLDDVDLASLQYILELLSSVFKDKKKEEQF